MNKINNKTKANTNQCSEKLIDGSEGGSKNEKLAEEIVNKSKGIKNGLINGLSADEKVKYSSKSVKKDKKIVKHNCDIKNDVQEHLIKSECVSLEEKIHLNNNIGEETCAAHDESEEQAGTSKEATKISKGKGKKNQDHSNNEQSSKKEIIDFDSPDFDITSLIRLKYNCQKSKKSESSSQTVNESSNDIAEKLYNLDMKEECKEEESLIENPNIEYIQYESELQMPMIMKIIQKDLSEPYSIYTYRYFIHNWPNLCFLAMCSGNCVGAIVCKLDLHRKVIKRGYIAMLAVDKKYRKNGIGSTLVQRAIQEMISGDADEVVLETEITNKPALRLYEALGFVRDKRLFRYYLNGVDALRLKLWLR